MAEMQPRSTKLAMTLVSTFSLLLIGTLWGAQLIKRPLLVISRWALLLALIAQAAWFSYLTAAQYFVWTQNPLSALLLPPTKSISYFIFYSFTEFWLNPLIALAAGFLLWLMMRRGNARFEQRFLYSEEPLLILISFLLIGHPLWIAYLTLILLCAIVASIYRVFMRKNSSPLPLLWLWLPAAIVILFLSPALLQLPIVSLLSL